MRKIMPGTTIDQLDIGIYIQYARRTELFEQINQQFHFKEAGTVPAQALIINLYPKLTELDLLLGVAQEAIPWAFFYPPKKFSFQRRSPFAFHRIAPLLGSSDKDDEEKDQKMNDIECNSEEEEQEKNTIRRCLKQVRDLNSQLRYIIGRIGQFLQG